MFPKSKEIAERQSRIPLNGANIIRRIVRIASEEYKKFELLELGIIDDLKTAKPGSSVDLL